jgi:cytidine deaminase
MSAGRPDRPELTGLPAGMGADDAALLRRARDLLERRYRAGRHEVASAMRLADGSIVTGLHVEASASRASVCAEGVAIGAAVQAIGDDVGGISAVVSVLRRPGGTWHLIEPCGVCAELLAEYAPASQVWVAVGDGVGPVEAVELLPFTRRRVARLDD